MAAVSLMPLAAAAEGDPHAAESAFVVRRSARISKLPPAPALPRVGPPDAHPIDRFVIANWEASAENHATWQPALCDDATFLRRVFLDVVGHIPTVAESELFLEDRSQDKRLRLIDNLLARDEAYAAHYATWWEDALASAKFNTFGGVLTRGDYQPWILERLRTNRPYDLMVAELIDPSLPGHPAPRTEHILGVPYRVSFLRNRNTPEVLQTASDVAQVFLGTAMKCASCHDHFENEEWSQARFLGFAGFFAADHLEMIRCEQPTGEMVATEWPFEQPGDDGDVPSGYEARLHRAAALLTDPLNPRFAPTLVNRLWKRFFGLGLYEPADDFRATTQPSHPELLAWLADDFVRHNYNVKHAIRQILSSQTYQQAYNPDVEDSFDIDQPNAPRWFRSPTLRRLTAEQLLDSLHVAAQQSIETKQRVLQRYHGRPNALTRALGRPDVRAEVSTGRVTEPALLQSLELLNGSTYQRLVDNSVLPRITRETRLQDLAGAEQRGVTAGPLVLTVDGASERIELKEATTLGQVIDTLNGSLATLGKGQGGDIRMGEGALILHANPGHTLQLADAPDSTLASDLGLAISATSSPVTGRPLRPRVATATQTTQQDSPTLAQVVATAPDWKTVAEYVYRATLSRPPSDVELRRMTELLVATAGPLAAEQRKAASATTADLFWALTSSPMFQYIE